MRNVYSKFAQKMRVPFMVFEPITYSHKLHLILNYTLNVSVSVFEFIVQTFEFELTQTLMGFAF